MASTNHEAFQLLHFLPAVLLPDLQMINLTPVTIKLSVDLFKIPPHYLGPRPHRRNQLLELQRESSKLHPIGLRLRPELLEFFIPLLQTKVYPLLDLQLDLHLTLKTISLQRRC